MPDRRLARIEGEHVRARLEELDWQQTPIGAISLRRRIDPRTGRDVHEVKLDDEYLMSSLFTEGEVELARLALARLPAGRSDLDVVVAGLGLGYTAAAVLEDPRAARLVVVDALAAVIGWHRAGLVPLGHQVSGDPRTRLVEGDFFALVAEERGLTGEPAVRRVDAVIVDVDHSPRHLLADSHAPFYTVAGLSRLRRHLLPGGVFALWSNDPPDEEFLTTLAVVFPGASAEVVTFDNPLQGRSAANTVYLGVAAPE